MPWFALVLAIFQTASKKAFFNALFSKIVWVNYALVRSSTYATLKIRFIISGNLEILLPILFNFTLESLTTWSVDETAGMRLLVAFQSLDLPCVILSLPLSRIAIRLLRTLGETFDFDAYSSVEAFVLLALMLNSQLKSPIRRGNWSRKSRRFQHSR